MIKNKYISHSIMLIVGALTLFLLSLLKSTGEYIALPIKNKKCIEVLKKSDSIQNIALDQRVKESQFESLTIELQKKADKQYIDMQFKNIEKNIDEMKNVQKQMLNKLLE